MSFFTAAQIAALSETTVRLAMLVEMRFLTETKYLWNGNTELEAGGNTYLPTYGYGQIDGIAQNGAAVSDPVNFRFSGIPNLPDSILEQVLVDTKEVEQRPVIVSLQLFDDDWQPYGNPIPVWHGLMQPPRVSRTQMQGEEGAVQSVSMVAENYFFNRSRPPYGAYTDRDQQKRSPGDKFCQFTNSLLFKTFPYPKY